MDDPLPADVLSAIAEERLRQLEKWGRQDHEPAQWLAILVAELGELAQALIEVDLRGHEQWRPYWHSGLVQLAAVAIAAAESDDRLTGGTG